MGTVTGARYMWVQYQGNGDLPEDDGYRKDTELEVPWRRVYAPALSHAESIHALPWDLQG